MPRKGPVEHGILSEIMEIGEEGILQSDLWRRVKADSREGSRAILRLEKKGLIERKKELYEGRWTYRVFAKRRYSTIDSIVEIPCSFCDIRENCIRDIDCEKLTEYLLRSSAGDQASKITV